METETLKTDVADFIKNISAPLCDNPASIEITVSNDERGVLVNLYVHQRDLGRMIGKKGSTASAMRNLLRVLGVKNDAHYSLKIDSIDNGPKEPSVSSIE